VGETKVLTGLVIYVILGGAYALSELRLFTGEAPEDCPEVMKFLGFIQMVNHLLRVLIVWPMYAVEDMVLYMSQYYEETEDDGDFE
jgi:hypothetical protein